MRIYVTKCSGDSDCECYGDLTDRYCDITDDYDDERCAYCGGRTISFRIEQDFETHLASVMSEDGALHLQAPRPEDEP